MSHMERSSRHPAAYSRSEGKQAQSWVLRASPPLIGEFLEEAEGWQAKGKAEGRVEFSSFPVGDCGSIEFHKYPSSPSSEGPYLRNLRSWNSAKPSEAYT